MPQVPMRYDPYNENIGIMGMQGSGKTTLAKDILDGLPRMPRIIWSPQRPLDLYGGYGEPIDDLKKLRRGAYLYVGEYGPRQFDQLCDKMMTLSNMMCVIDDVHEYVKKQQIPENFARLINSGRNRGICSIFLTPSPNLVHNNLLQSCQHVFCFSMRLESQILWLARNFFGPDAYCLLRRPLRRITPTVGNEYDVLPPHSYLYSKHTDTTATLYVHGAAAQVSEATPDEPPGGAPNSAGGAPPPPDDGRRLDEIPEGDRDEGEAAT